MSTLNYNELPRPTFRWMKVNHLELDPMAVPSDAEYKPELKCEGDAVTIGTYDGADWPGKDVFTGSNEEALDQALHHGNTHLSVTLPANETASVWISYHLDDVEDHIAGALRLEAGDNSKLMVYLMFDGGDEDASVNLAEYIYAGENATVKISKVQLNGHQVRHVEHRYATGGANSHIDYVSAEVGGQKTLVYYKTDLMKDESAFDSRAMYLGDRDQIFDFSYWVPTQGIKTNTNILTTGALMDTSKKYFRGTIDFLRGGKKAVGDESDICLLLSPKVHSISIPLLLCKEDDVVGNHASSAGQIDKDKLFYLMSRGFNEQGAQLIIVESNIRPVIDALGDKDLENKALQAVREKMQFCRRKGDCSDKCTKRFPDLD